MSVEQHLKDHDLRVTDVRKRVYLYFKRTPGAASHSELESAFQDDFDRVTIYRTLHTFMEKGILHKIPTDTGSAKYALCSDDCNEDHHYDNHVHFKCRECGNLICLHDLEIPKLRLPGNFKVESSVLMYEGICDNCN